MLLRCRLDGLILDAQPQFERSVLLAFDGDEGFDMERMEVLHYELIAASQQDLTWLQRVGYRCLRTAADFTLLPDLQSV